MLANSVSTKTLFVSDNDIIPQDYQNMLLYWRDVYRAGNFHIGDIANEIAVYARQSAFIVTEQQIFDAVGRFVGKSGRTIRYYAETAEFFSKDIRDEFDMLPFCHFVVARRFRSGYRDVLEFARDHPGMGEEGLLAHFLRGNTTGQAPMFNAVDIDVETDDPHTAESYVPTYETAYTSQTQEYMPKPSSLLHSISNLRADVNTLKNGLTLLSEHREEIESMLVSIESQIPRLLKLIQDGLAHK